MKKLLVTLLLAAGLVTVASANTPLACTPTSSNQCCIDTQNMNDSINSSPSRSIPTIDDYFLSILDTQVDTSQPGRCETPASYLINGVTEIETFKWVPGYMEGTFFPANS